MIEFYFLLVIGGKKVTLSAGKTASEIKGDKLSVNELHQVGKNDVSVKDIAFVNWFPSSFLSKPSRSPVCIFILLNIC
jgi:hypothetical protein